MNTQIREKHFWEPLERRIMLYICFTEIIRHPNWKKWHWNSVKCRPMVFCCRASQVENSTRKHSPLLKTARSDKHNSSLCYCLGGEILGERFYCCSPTWTKQQRRWRNGVFVAKNLRHNPSSDKKCWSDPHVLYFSIDLNTSELSDGNMLTSVLFYPGWLRQNKSTWALPLKATFAWSSSSFSHCWQKSSL